MQDVSKVYMPVVLAELAARRPARILDLPSGLGWLGRAATGFDRVIDGIDLFEAKPDGYGSFWLADLDAPLPVESAAYDAVVTCEGIEHIGNPLLFLGECFRALRPGGMVIVTTPNVWSPSSKLKYALRGFFPGFPNLVGKIERGTHMHLTPFSFPQLYLFMRLAGFENIRLKETAVRKPRHAFERPLGWPQKRYCRKGGRLASTEEEQLFWRDAGSDDSVYGRAMVVVARKPL